MCPEPPSVYNSNVTVRGYGIGDSALYTCDPDYIMLTEDDVPNWQSICSLDDNNKATAVWKPIQECTSW